MNIGNDAVELYVSKVKPLVYQRIFRSVMAYISGSGESYQSITQRVNTIADSKTRFALMAVLAKNASIISEAEANQAINAAPSRQMMHVLRALLAGSSSGPAVPSYYLNLTIPGGSPVTIADGQARGTITSTYNAVITASMSPSRTTGVAPLYVNFDMTGTTSTLSTNPTHECFFATDFGDSGAGTWANGVQSAGLTSKNAGYGPVTGHVYETPGTYTVTMSVTDGVNTATKTGTIVVQDPDVVYAGTDTICLSHSGNFTGAPSGATQINTSGNTDMYSAWVAHKASNKRILFCKADAWTASAILVFWGITGTTVSGYGVGAARSTNFGTVSDTLVNVTPSPLAGPLFSIQSGTSDIRIGNFKIAADSTTMAGVVEATIDSVLFHKIEIRGCSAGYDAFNGVGGLNRVMDQLCLYECLVDELYGYAGVDTPRGSASGAIGTPGVFTATSHPFAVGYRVQLTGTPPTPLITGTDYYICETSLTSNTFTLSATRGGSALALSGAGTCNVVTQGQGGGIGAFVALVRGGVMGCYFDSCNHGEQTLRIPYIDRGHISNNYIARPNQGKNVLKIHSFIYSQTPLYSEKFVVTANVMDLRGGYSYDGISITQTGYCLMVIGTGGNGHLGGERVRDGIVENNFTYGGLGNPKDLLAFAQIDCPNMTIRNNIADFSVGDRTTAYTAPYVYTGMYFATLNTSTPDPTIGVRIYNNTLYSNLANAEHANFTRVSAPDYGYPAPDQISIKNNLWYTPHNLSSSKSACNNFGAGTNIVTSNNTDNGQTSTTSPNFAVTPPVALADWKPSGYPVNSGATVPVLRDFNNATRVGGTYDMGAVLP